jgi:peptidoglycan/xylan/chitin deacetylase (PgdA/CDA1 family)
MSYGNDLSRYLKMRPRTERSELLEGVLDARRKLDIVPTRMMTVGEIRQLQGAHEIGCHSYSHESMGYEPIDFFRDDFARSKAFHQNELGAPISIYAFPNGSYTPQHLDELRREGVKHILVVDDKVSSNVHDVHARLTFYADSRAEARLQAVGWRSQAREVASSLGRRPGRRAT